jgi:hypothetical protein
MAISGFNEPLVWTAGALVFSGRPAPTWQLTAAQADALLGIWSNLRVVDDRIVDSPDASRLGYAGSRLTNNRGDSWLAQNERVLSRFDSKTECRADPERRFERLLLSTAPAGLLPSNLIDA